MYYTLHTRVSLDEEVTLLICFSPLQPLCQPCICQIMLHLPTAAATADIEPIDTGEQVCSLHCLQCP